MGIAAAAELLDVGGHAHLGSYAAEARKHRHKPSQQTRSQLPSPAAAEEMLQFDRELFTEDGWQGMQGCVRSITRAPAAASLLSEAPCSVYAYTRYIKGLEAQEEEPGCEQCTANRLQLEQVWQASACLLLWLAAPAVGA